MLARRLTLDMEATGGRELTLKDNVGISRYVFCRHIGQKGIFIGHHRNDIYFFIFLNYLLICVCNSSTVPAASLSTITQIYSSTTNCSHSFGASMSASSKYRQWPGRWSLSWGPSLSFLRRRLQW